MMTTGFLSFCYCVLSALVLSPATGGVSATQELNPESYQELTTSGKNGMVKFFQPWCGHCKKIKPDWDKLAKEAHSSVFIADVNCSNERELCKEHGVHAYPTIKVYLDGSVDNYRGARKYEAFAAFADAELASKCDIENASKTCSKKAVAYLTKWRARDVADVEEELKQLVGLSLKSYMMEDYMKAWLRERKVILQQLAKAPKTKSSWW